jgi:hypothetical protein
MQTKALLAILDYPKQAFLVANTLAYDAAVK